jgi:hypothetical protein
MAGCFQQYPGFPTTLLTSKALVALKHRLIGLLKHWVCVGTRLVSVYHLVVSMSRCVDSYLEQHPEKGVFGEKNEDGEEDGGADLV